MFRTTQKSITPEQRRKLLRKAKSIQKKADDLMSELMKLVGEDHPSTDYADNILLATEEMIDVISNKEYDMWNSKEPVVLPVA